MIVVDANVLASLVMPGESSELAEGLLRLDPDWFAPALVVSELTSLVLKGIRLGRLSSRDAVGSLQLALELLGEHRVDPDPERVLALAHESGCTTYDCEYVAVAESLDCRLATFDVQVLNAFPDRTRHPERLLAG